MSVSTVNVVQRRSRLGSIYSRYVMRGKLDQAECRTDEAWMRGDYDEADRQATIAESYRIRLGD